MPTYIGHDSSLDIDADGDLLGDRVQLRLRNRRESIEITIGRDELRKLIDEATRVF
jgi:hypothetical protein